MRKERKRRYPQYDPVPETCVEALAQWDKGAAVWTVELGGLGPGYEQVIHLLVFELLREHLTDKLLVPIAPDWGDATVHRVNLKLGRWGFSGAQVGAAKTLAARALQYGWRATICEFPADRHIQVVQGFPTSVQ